MPLSGARAMRVVGIGGSPRHQYSADLDSVMETSFKKRTKRWLKIEGPRASATAARHAREPHCAWAGEGEVVGPYPGKRFDRQSGEAHGHVLYARLDTDQDDGGMFQAKIGANPTRRQT